MSGNDGDKNGATPVNAWTSKDAPIRMEKCLGKGVQGLALTASADGTWWGPLQGCSVFRMFLQASASLHSTSTRNLQ